MKNKINKRLLCFILPVILFLLPPPHLRSGAETIAEGQVTVKGLTLTVEPAQQTVPMNTPTAVNTELTVETRHLARGVVIKGELRGPGLSTPLTLTTLPGHPFSIPGFAYKGDYYLENIRLERDGQKLLQAQPASVLIRSMDVVVTRVETRPLSLDEIREKGISITDENFTVFNFSVGIIVESKEYRYEFPVVYSNNEPFIPSFRGGGFGGSGIGAGFAGGKSAVPFEMKLHPSEPEKTGLDEVTKEGSGGKLSGLLIFNNDIAVLNQFFSVMFIVANNAPDGSPLALKDVTARITYPDELREAETTPPHVAGTAIPVRCPGPDGEIGTADDLDIILATFNGMAEFLAEGLQKGTHILKVDFEGTLTGLPNGDVPVQGSASGSVVVRHPEFSVNFSHPAVIREGEEYDVYVTVTNTSAVPVNLFSLTMPAGWLVGTELLSEETVSFEVLEPGQFETAEFRMKSKKTGKVRASAFQADENIVGRLILTVGVGEAGIPLSPDTLVLPTYAYSLPNEIVNPAMMALGEAYSIARTSPGGLPSHLPMVNTDAVENRVIELAEAGQRIYYGENQLNSLQVLTLDWLGNRNPDLPFDVLRRLTTKGIKWADALSTEFNVALAGGTPESFLDSFAQTCSYKNSFFAALLSFNGGTRRAGLTITDYYQNALTASGEEPVRDIPFGEIYSLEDGTQSPVDLALVGHVDDNGYSVEVTAETSGTFDLCLIVPDSDEGLNKVVFNDIACQAGDRFTITVKSGDSIFKLAKDVNGTPVDIPADSANAVLEPLLQLTAAVQDCRVDWSGHVAALLFNRSVSKETANNRMNYTVPGKNVYASFLQPSERVVLVGLDSPVSPYVESRIRVENLLDGDGGGMQTSPVEMPILATITSPGGIVYGKVLTASGHPVAHTSVRLDEKEGDNTRHSYTRSDSRGNYQFDFVRVLKSPFSLTVTDTDTGRSEKIYSQLRANGQRLNLNLYLRGRGSVSGRVTDTDDEPLAEEESQVVLVYASADNEGKYEYFNVRCDLDGTYEISDLPLGAVSLRAVFGNRSGNADTVIAYDGEHRHGIDITVGTILTGDVVGRILENDGETPVPEATLYIYRNDKPLNFIKNTDENGFFKFENVSVGDFVIYTSPGPTVTGSVTANGSFYTDIILRGTGTVFGTVKGYNGEELGDVPVFMINTAFETKTDSDEATKGQFRFEDVRVGSYSVAAYDGETGELYTGGVNLRLEGDSVGTTITFPPPPLVVNGGIQISAVDGNGDPLTGPTIEVYDESCRFVGFAVLGSGDDYYIDNLPPGGYTVALRHAGGNDAARTVITMAGLSLVTLTPRGTGTIEVNVFDDDGTTPVVADVTVRYPQFVFRPGRQVGIAMTEDHFTTDGSTLTIGSVYPGTFTVTAKSSFYPQGAFAHGTIDSADDVKTANLVMEPTGELKVTVVDPNDTPVQNVNLIFSTTAAQGTEVNLTDFIDWPYTMPLVPPGSFTIEAVDTVSTFKNIIGGYLLPGQASEEVTITLKGKGTVEVTVTEPNSPYNVIQGATVTLKNTGYPYETVPVTDNQDGTYTFNNVYEGGFSVEAHDTIGRGGRATGIIENNGDSVNVTIRLNETWTVIGNVFQPDNTTPAAGVPVVLYGGNGAFGNQTTGDDGGFQFQYVTEGTYWLEAENPFTGLKGQSAAFYVNADVDTDVRIKGRGTVSGIVYDGSGTTPLASADVSLKSGAAGSFSRDITAEDNGSFTYELVDEGSFTLSATDPVTQLQVETTGTIDYHGHNVFINIYAAPTGTVTGTVFESDGTTPVTGASVSLAGTGKSAATSTDGGGIYTFNHIPTGVYTLSADVFPDSGTASGTIDKHGDVKTVDIQLEGLGTVGGTVLDGGGTPVDDVNVTIRAGNGIFQDSTSTQNGGQFSFQGIPPGDFSVEATSSTSGFTTGTLAAGQTASVTVSLEEAGSVTGNVIKNLDGGTTGPAEGAYITLTGTAQPSGETFILYTQSDENGNFQFPVVRKGDFSIQILGSAGAGRAMLTDNTITTNGETKDFPGVLLDNVKPSVSATVPANGSGDVDVTGTTVTVSFSEAMDPATLIVDNFAIVEQNNGITFTLTPGTGNTSVELVPDSTLAGNKQYVVFVKDTVTDLAGNALAAPATITFTTIDNVKPTVLSITPPTPESGDSGPPVFTVTFSEPIDESEFDEQNIAFLKDGTPAPYSYDFGEGSMTVVITPGALVDNSTYSVTVQNADDMAGNTQTAVYTMDFFTPDTIAPQLSGLEFDPGLNVSVGEPVTATAEIAANDAEDVAKVYFYINGELKHTDETSPYSYLFNAPIMGGTGSTFTVEAYAEDAAANRSSLSAVVALGDYVDLIPPVVDFVAPTGGSLVFPGEVILLRASVTDENSFGIASVTFLVNGVTAGNGTETATGIYDYSYTVPNETTAGSILTIAVEGTDIGNKTTTLQTTAAVVSGELLYLTDGDQITAADSTDYSAKTVIIRNGEVTIDGAHTFTNVLVKEGGTLTHSPCTTTAVYNMELTVTGKVVVGPESRIDVSERGYLGGYRDGDTSKYGRTLGNTATGAGYAYSGGSYGGYGYRGHSTAGVELDLNDIYGSVTEPSDHGSGGGGYDAADPGGNGGGVLKITAGTLIVDGSIYSNGGSGIQFAGGGSGSSITLDVTTLGGRGPIRAEGGESYYQGPGGGGRIAVYYGDAAGFNLDNITAPGGQMTTGSTYYDADVNGSAGTVYLKKTGDDGLLVIDNNGRKSYNTLIFPDAKQAVSASVSGKVLTAPQGTNYMTNCLAGMKLIPDTDDPETVFTIKENTADTITVDGETDILSAAGGKTYKIVMVVDGHLKIVNTHAEISGDLEADELTVTSNGSLSLSEPTIAAEQSLFITAAKVTIDSGSSIDVSGDGYPAGYRGGNNSKFGYTHGNDNTDGSDFYSGASHGGLAGFYTTTTATLAFNPVYGSLYKPTAPGSGGGGYASNQPGGNGGGALRIQAAELIVNGVITADGESTTNWTGGGAGGSIYINVGTLTLNGSIHADGGGTVTQWSSAGGGGRVAVYYDTWTAQDVTKITSRGGTYSNSTNTDRNGGAGTVYLIDKTTGQDHLIISNNNVATRAASTPLPAVGTGTYNSLSGQVMTVTDPAAFIDGALAGIKLNPYPTQTTPVFTIISNTGDTVNTDPADGAMTGNTNYIGEHHLYYLTVKGLARVSTTDRIIVDPSRKTVETGSELNYAGQ